LEFCGTAQAVSQKSLGVAAAKPMLKIYFILLCIPAVAFLDGKSWLPFALKLNWYEYQVIAKL
jgi:hypothetical protein